MNSAIRSYDLPAFDFDIGNAKVVGTIKARWQNGKLSYVFSLAPADPLLPRNGMPEALNPYFTASFVDKDGFEIVRTRFPVKEMSPESDDLIVRGETPIDSTRAAKISS